MCVCVCVLIIVRVNVTVVLSGSNEQLGEMLGIRAAYPHTDASSMFSNLYLCCFSSAYVCM